jgi:hypothetical protein
MTTWSRIAATVAGLWRWKPSRTSPVDAFDALLAAAVETGGVITVPGIARWLTGAAPEPDDSVESYEAYLNRISEQVA